MIGILIAGGVAIAVLLGIYRIFGPEKPKPPPEPPDIYMLELALKRYLRPRVNDADRFEVIGCLDTVLTKTTENIGTYWIGQCAYRATNAFGALVREDILVGFNQHQIISIQPFDAGQ